MGKYTKDATKDAGKPVLKDKTKLKAPTVNGWGERTSQKYVEKGKFKAGKLHGPGERTFHDWYGDDLWRGSVQEGRFEYGIFVEGTEKRTKKGIVLEGTFKRFLAGDHPDQCDDADIEQSEFISGTKTAPDGTVSKGTFTPRAAYCVLHGDDCVETTPDGIVRKGTFDNGLFKTGTETTPDGIVRKGTFFPGGGGKGKITYTVEGASQLPNVIYNPYDKIEEDGAWAEGTWDQAGKLQGFCKLVHESTFVYEGTFVNDCLVQGKWVEPGGFCEGTFDDKGRLHGPGKDVRPGPDDPAWVAYCKEEGVCDSPYHEYGDPYEECISLWDWPACAIKQGTFCHGELQE